MDVNTIIGLVSLLMTNLIALVVFYRKSIKHQIRREERTDNRIANLERQRQEDKMAVEEKLINLRGEIDDKFKLMQSTLDTIRDMSHDYYIKNEKSHEKIYDNLVVIKEGIAKINGILRNGNK